MAEEGPSTQTSPLPSYTYDVYLSFRRSDTRNNFISHLDSAILLAGFHTFRDDQHLRRGDDFASNLLKAIYESRMSIVVFSENYASSVWCLEELVMILECKRNHGHLVLPVFYHVDPSDVRKQKGIFDYAFAKLEQIQPLSKVNGWRAALTQATDISGMVLTHGDDESQLIKNIVREIEDKQLKPLALGSPYLIGIHSRAEKINLWLQDGSTDVGICVIYGMRGVGKTAIAKHVYNSHFQKFEGSSFLENMRETLEQQGGLITLQEQLLSDILKYRGFKINNASEGATVLKRRLAHRRVLIVLDDVDDIHQINRILEMGHSLCRGSKIIITTTNLRLSKAHPGTMCHFVESLDRNESLELFSWHAFGQDHPFEGYLKHSERMVDHCGGLPSALVILGSSLRGNTSIEEWQSLLEKLLVIPNREILDLLRISYDSLEEHEKKLFLDIACFFIGKNRDSILTILDACGFYTILGIQILIERSLIKIDKNNKVQMHPMIRDMGREIVRLESHPQEPQKRSRLWDRKDSLKVLATQAGTGNIRGLALNMHPKQKLVLETSAFSGMFNLRLLQFSHVELNGTYEKFPRRLRWLCWLGSPLYCIPNNFCLNKVVVVEMHYSSLRCVWKGTYSLPSLKILDVSHSHDLVEVCDDFSTVPNLERLILKDCGNLVGIHESIGVLQKLRYLNLENCTSISKYPKNMPESLQTVTIMGCSNIGELTVTQTRRMKFLKQLDIDRAQVMGLFSGAAKSGRSLSDYTGLDKTLELAILFKMFPICKLQLMKNMFQHFGVAPTRLLLHHKLESLSSKYLEDVVVKFNLDPVKKEQLDKIDPKLTSSETGSLPPLVAECSSSGTRVDQGSTIMKDDADLEEKSGHVEQVVSLSDEVTLTPSLKQLLFLYCSVLPLDYEFKKYDLVHLWVAQGFIGENQARGVTLEDTGISYFNSLENDGYFVPSRRDFSIDFDSLCSVPIYNPSNFLYKVNTTRLSVLEPSSDHFRAVNVGQLCGASDLMTKHLSLMSCETNDEKIFGVVKKFKNLQSLFLLSDCGSTIQYIPRDLFLSLQELRTLNLSGSLISGLPSSIGDAKELRYLDVSRTPITWLPESIGTLHQLQTLKLRGCVHFSILPRAIKNLTNLRHIELDIILQLDSMPPHLGNLTNLQTLSAFLVGGGDGCRITELENLNDLKGALTISRLENVSRKEAKDVALSNKKNLQRLNLQWSDMMLDDDSGEEKELSVQIKEKNLCTEAEKILEFLRPPDGLKELQIQHYAGSILPAWISNRDFAHLVVITLYRCINCKIFPSLGKLPGLKSLSIIEMNAVEEINHEYFGNDQDGDDSLQAFPKLEILEVDIMLNLKHWSGVKEGDLPSLLKLTVESCPNLVSLPSLSKLKFLKHLEFRRCSKLQSLPEGCLPTSLQSLVIKDCPQLEKSCHKDTGDDWSKICNVPSVWCNDEEIISQGSSDDDSDDVVQVQSVAEKELMECVKILNNMKEIGDDSYSKALKFLHDEISWRKVFLHMAHERRKGFILSL